MKIEDIINHNPKAVVLQPRGTYDQAVIGISSDGRIIYSEEKLLMALQEVDGKTFEEAVDHYEKNTIASLSYANRFSPIIATETA